jgi:hypothetical protein
VFCLEKAVIISPQNEQRKKGIMESSTPQDEATLAEHHAALHVSLQEVKVKEGDQVMYVLPNGRSAGESRPAFVVRAWNGGPGANLMVLTDCTNDFLTGPGATGLLWATSVPYSAEKRPGTWHWPEKA